MLNNWQFIHRLESIQWTAEAVTAAGTIALAFLTFILAIGTMFLWFATRRLVKSAGVTAERQLRAYVTVKSSELIEQGQKRRDKLVHYIDIYNTGKTPAYNLSVRSVTRILKHPVGEHFDFKIIEASNPSNTMLGPGKDVVHISEGHTVFSNQELAEIANSAGSKRVYTYGIVSYRDAFGIDRFTNFCYFLEWTNIHDSGHTISCQASEYHNDGN